MAEVIVFPDAVATLKVGLDDASLGVPVVHAVPHPRPAAFVQLTRTGGTNHAIVVDRAMVTVDCWAATSPAAMTLAQLVRAHLHAMNGEVVDGTAVYGVNELAGPGEVPDPDSDTPRVRQTFQIGLRATAT